MSGVSGEAAANEAERLIFNLFFACSQGAGRADEAARGQRVGPGEKRAAQGAGEAAAENGAEGRADPQTAQTQKTGRRSR